MIFADSDETFAIETEIKTPLYAAETVTVQKKPLMPLPILAPQRVRDVINATVAPQQIAIDMSGHGKKIINCWSNFDLLVI